MMDREKVINKVKAIVADMQEEVDEWKDYSDSELRNGLTCDCDWWYKTLQTLNDALALLKAQEPRVMTLEEAQGEDYCWYESRVANICVLCEATMYPNPNGKPKTELQQMGTWMRGWQYDDEYGKTWRCWTSRPTDERREATPWN